MQNYSEYNTYTAYQNVIFIILALSAMSIISTSAYTMYQNYAMLCFPIFLTMIFLRVHIPKNVSKNFVIMIIFAYYGIFSLLVVQNPGIGAIVNTLLIFLIHIVLKLFGLRKNQLKALAVLYFFICAGYAFASEDYAALHYASIMASESKYVNPNAVSFMVAIFSFFIWLELFQNVPGGHKIIKFVFGLLLLAMNVSTILNLNSRSSYLALIIFIISIYFIPKKFFFKKNRMTFLFLGAVLASFLIPQIYIYMYKNGITISGILSIDKQTFTGRELIWIELFNTLETPTQWLFGIGSKASILDATDMHNASLTFLKNSGIISLFIIYGYIAKEIKSLFTGKVNDAMVTYLLTFMSAFVISFFESTFISSQCIFIMMLFLYLAYCEKMKLEGFR